MTRDTIQVLHNVFLPAQLQDLAALFKKDGHRCNVCTGFEKIVPAIRDPRTRLLLLGTTDDKLPQVAQLLRSGGEDSQDVPVIVYIEQNLPGARDELLLPEINDFLLAPLNLQDVLLRVRRLLQRFAETEDDAGRVKLNLASYFGMRQFIGKAPAFVAAIKKMQRAATCDATVLLIGDTGTGKEMCARAIHYLSPRAERAFIPVNCGSIPADLFENEMFGHETGAFTDARRALRGVVAEAEGGTLFLDEVDSLPLPAQVKLLRFLQDRQYRPLGGSRFHQADVRMVAASNQSLENRVQDGWFREDLYYRLKVVSLELPALRDRQEDIVPLAQHFLNTSACEYKRPAVRFSQVAIQKLMTYRWPGNVRELENVVRHAVVLADGPVIRARDIHLLSESAVAAPQYRESFKIAKARAVEAFERDYLKDILSVCGGNISRAAREAQKDRRAFFALLKKYNLTSPDQSFLEEHTHEDALAALG